MDVSLLNHPEWAEVEAVALSLDEADDIDTVVLFFDIDVSNEDGRGLSFRFEVIVIVLVETVAFKDSVRVFNLLCPFWIEGFFIRRHEVVFL